MTTTDRLAADLAALDAAMAGDVVTPADAGWDAARQAWNLTADQHPAAVAFAENTNDVVAVVRFARERGLRVAPQTTGHAAPALPGLQGSLLLKTSRMTGVEIDPDRRTARAEGGALWEHVAVPAADHGLAALHGSSGGVGVVGYTLQGGLGWLARRHGLACNSVVAAEVVTADGGVLQVDADHEPELFWALRGGTGSFGVVTALEFALYELSEVYAGQLMWPQEQAPEVIAAFGEWATGAPDTATTSVKLANFPPIPAIPEPLRGRSLVSVGVAFCGSQDEGEAVIAPLREVGERYLDTVATIPAADLRWVAGDPPNPVPGQTGGFLLRDLPREALDAYVEVSGPGSGSPLLFLEVRPLGGALARSSPDHGALDRLDAAATVYGVGMPVPPPVGRAISAHFDRVEEALAPWQSESRLLSFADRSRDAADGFQAETYARLRRAKARYDPDQLILSSHEVTP